MIGVVIFVAVLAALLAIPLTLTFQVSWQEAFRNETELEWAFGLVHKRILPAKSTPVTSESEQPDRHAGRSQSSTRTKLKFLNALGQEDFRHRITRFIGDIWQAAQKEDVKVRLRVGLGDPADTGQLYAYLGPISGILGSVQDLSVEIEPEFIDETLEFSGDGRVRIIPLQIIYLAAILMLSPPIWRAIRQMYTQEPSTT